MEMRVVMDSTALISNKQGGYGLTLRQDIEPSLVHIERGCCAVHKIRSEARMRDSKRSESWVPNEVRAVVYSTALISPEERGTYETWLLCYTHGTEAKQSAGTEAKQGAWCLAMRSIRHSIRTKWGCIPRPLGRGLGSPSLGEGILV